MFVINCNTAERALVIIYYIRINCTFLASGESYDISGTIIIIELTHFCR